MKTKFFKKMLCTFSCAALLACSTLTFASASSAEISADALIASTYTPEGKSNISVSGPLTIESHLQARMGYPSANYSVYIYAPSDVTGIQINDMDILNSNSVHLYGSVGWESPGSIYKPITVKVTLLYDDKMPYTSYETINVSYWCGVDHAITDHCTP